MIVFITDVNGLFVIYFIVVSSTFLAARKHRNAPHGAFLRFQNISKTEMPKTNLKHFRGILKSSKQVLGKETFFFV